MILINHDNINHYYSATFPTLFAKGVHHIRNIKYIFFNFVHVINYSIPTSS